MSSSEKTKLVNVSENTSENSFSNARALDLTPKTQRLEDDSIERKKSTDL